VVRVDIGGVQQVASQLIGHALTHGAPGSACDDEQTDHGACCCNNRTKGEQPMLRTAKDLEECTIEANRFAA
jgi:hypothetical protein